MTTVRRKTVPAVAKAGKIDIDKVTVEEDDFTKAIKEVNTSYVKIDNTIYTLNKVSVQGLDVENEIKEFYKKKYVSLKTSLESGIRIELERERNATLAHLAKINDRGTVSVPSTLFGKLVVYFNGDLCVCRTIRYSPQRFVGSWTSFEDYVNSADACRLANVESTEELSNAGYDLEATIEQKILDFPLTLAYSKKMNKIYTPFDTTFHTYSDKRVCTGDHDAHTWWKLPPNSLSANINTVNLSSMAQNASFNGEVYRAGSDLLRGHALKTFRITTRKGADTWTV